MSWLPIHQKYHQVLGYKWEPTGVQRRVATILSKMIKYRGQKLFRAGLKNQEASSTLLFMTFDLARIGIHDVVVLYKSPSDESVVMEPIQSSVGCLQLFTLDFDAPQSGNLSFTFEVYIGSPELLFRPSIAYYYFVQPFDGLLGRQLWSSSVDQVGTDVELVTNDGTRFHAHKFLLAARSTVFAAQFRANATQVEQERNFQDALSLEQFLKFLYTGELEGVVNSKLLQLAETYKILSLITLCEQGLRGQDQLAEDLASLSMMIKTDPDVLEINPNTESEMLLQQNACILSLTWKVSSGNRAAIFESNSRERSKVSGAFSLKSGEIFSVKATLKSQQEMVVSFLVGQDPVKSYVDQVACYLNDDIDDIYMFPSVDRATNQALMFTRTISSTQHFPDKITFHLKLVSKIVNFNYSFRDRFGEDIWALAHSQRFSDVQVVLGARAFRAHRALLSARSPVFKAMFTSGMEEARTGRVKIDDVDPETFDQFLRFLYHGEANNYDADMKRNLYAVADRYQVGTLIQICKPTVVSVGSVDVENLMDAFLSC